ncbi:MAG: YebC/PmpR family DNA-binding transcriptional regulator [Patescibacteria group bacterium]
MAGHSRWTQIKRQKGVADVKRGALFAKLASGITIAARHGADPEMNFQLRIAIDKARAANMPKDNIERAIERAGGSGADAIEEALYEAYGPGGTAFLIEAATDNRNRTVGEIKATLARNGGKLAESGSVSYLFKKLGQIVFEKLNPDEVELAAIDAGAQDVEHSDGQVFVYTDPKELESVRKNLEKVGFIANDVGFEWQPTSTVTITDQETAEKVLRLAEALDDLDDVTRVSGNFEVDPKLLD